MYDTTLNRWPSIYPAGHIIAFEGPEEGPITTTITIMREGFPTLRGKAKHATYRAACEAALNIVQELQNGT